MEVTKSHVIAEKNDVGSHQLPECIAGLSVALAAVVTGSTIAWTSPAGEDGENLRYSFKMNSEEFSWVGSILPIGGALACVPAGMLSDWIGRKKAVLFLIAPSVIGWILVIWPNSLGSLITGRFMLGASGGALFVAIPMYACEIADDVAQARLCSFFTLFFYVGILMSYALGLLRNMFVMSLICALVTIAFFVSFIFMPESPTYFLMKGNIEAARKSLLWFRGPDYDIETELRVKLKSLRECENQVVPFFESLKAESTRKGLVITFGLMFFQSFSGVDAVLFNVSDIITDATGGDGTLSAVVVGTMQVVAVAASNYLMDICGRRNLLLIPGSMMCLSTLVFGVFSYYREHGANLDHFGWVPLASISCFLVSFGLGYAALPWIIIGELFSPHIKTLAASSAIMLGWLMAFAVTILYSSGKNIIGRYGVFCTYSATIALGNAFSYFYLPETKGKTLEQIQIDLSGDKILNGVWNALDIEKYI